MLVFFVSKTWHNRPLPERKKGIAGLSCLRQERIAAMRMTHVIVTGLVQGVCFRDYTRRRAFTLGLTGWVRNLPNGSVEAMLSGPTDKIAEMVEWLPQGSPHSRVDELRLDDVHSDEEYTSFQIRY